jgi:hypothetical protein
VIVFPVTVEPSSRVLAMRMLVPVPIENLLFLMARVWSGGPSARTPIADPLTVTVLPVKDVSAATRCTQLFPSPW